MKRNGEFEPTSRVTVKDVARVAGVSLGTVSRVINGADVGAEYIQRVNDAIQQTGYRPNLLAGTLARKKKPLRTYHAGNGTDQIGYFTNGLGNMDQDEAQLHFLIGVERKVTASGRHLLCSVFKQDLETGKLPMVIQEQKVDGAVLKLGYDEPGMRLAADIAKVMPVVLVEALAEDAFASSVLNDSYSDIRKLIQHLRELGHTRIGFFHVKDVGGPPPHRLLEERLEAFLSIQRRNGVSNEESMLYISERDWNKQSLDDVSAQVIQQLKSRGSQAPTAIMCASDIHAVSLCQAAEKAGLKIPDHLSITGQGDMRRQEPRAAFLTTTTEPALEIGTTAAEVLLNQLENPEKPVQQIRIAGKLVIRGSTSKPRSGEL